MNFLKRGIFLISVLAAIFAARTAAAQVPTTTISDTVYFADGTPAQGTIILSWNAFTTANGAAIAAGTTTVTLGSGGTLTIALAPNAGSTPMGNFYTAVYHLNDGETSREFWIVPVIIPGGGPAKLAGIRNQVLPTSVAMQTVTKQYVDQQIAAAEIAPLTLGSSPFVLKTGDTMTGPLVLPGDPASALQAADKNYVDNSIAAVNANFATWTPSTPTLTCGTATFTATMRSRTIGKTASFNLDATISVVGTCAGTISLPVPLTAKSNSVGNCVIYAGSGVGTQGEIFIPVGSSTGYIAGYNNQILGATGSYFACNYTGETQ